MIHPILHSQLTHSMTQDSERRTKNSKPATSFFQKKMVNDLFNSQHFNPWWICFQHHQRQLCVFRGRLRAVEVATSMLQAWRARLSLAEVHVFFFPGIFFKGHFSKKLLKKRNFRDIFRRNYWRNLSVDGGKETFFQQRSDWKNGPRDLTISADEIQV